MDKIELIGFGVCDLGVIQVFLFAWLKHDVHESRLDG